MFSSLPAEIVCSIVELCPARDQARLARTCRRLCDISVPILYRSDVRSGGSCVHYAITRCSEEAALGTLQEAYRAGCDLKRCRERSSSVTFSDVHAPIYLAARRGLHEVVTFLLDAGVAADGLPDHDVTPLLGALLAGHERTSLLLARRGASLRPGRFPMNALHASVCGRLYVVAGYLLGERGMDANERTGCGATPMMLALSAGDASMAELLLSHEGGADDFALYCTFADCDCDWRCALDGLYATDGT